MTTETTHKELRLRVQGMHCHACEKMVSMNAGNGFF